MSGPPTARDICPVLAFYLREHARPATRGIHLPARQRAHLCWLGVASGRAWYFPLALVSGYAPAGSPTSSWRRTAGNVHLSALVSSFRLQNGRARITGRLERELTKAGIAPLTRH